MNESRHVTDPKTLPSMCSKRRRDHKAGRDPGKSGNADLWERGREQKTGTNGQQETVSAK